MSKSTALDIVALDADDTLWENEHFFRLTEKDFQSLLADHADPDHLAERLIEIERRNLRLYGFGIKGFTLSMIETAIEITNGEVSGKTIAELVEIGRTLMQHPIHLVAGARETVETLATDYSLMLITKGDLFDQERKIAQSGLADLFDRIEIVGDKTPEAYQRVFETAGVAPDRVLMAGNSVKSDVLPVLDIGGWGVFVPHPLTWAFEHAEEPAQHVRFRRVGALTDLPELVAGL
ncbi:MAG: HAD family hydrolase [Hyphomicrobiaceae bacterium]|nr:HAD family hydrolase [Hyphomicrobiaceae bacterium]MCC0023322.1 HAD family hydrolase [Hyphomicrobiaceae bacterium]